MFLHLGIPYIGNEKIHNSKTLKSTIFKKYFIRLQILYPSFCIPVYTSHNYKLSIFIFIFITFLVKKSKA